MSERIPQVDSTWQCRSGGVATVTEVVELRGKPNVAYTTAWPGTDRWSVGIADLDYFLTHHTEATR